MIPEHCTEVHFAHIVDFDIGALPEGFFANDHPLTAARELFVGVYAVQSDSLATYSGLSSSFLQHYQYHYQRRIKPQFRATRGTTVVELRPLHLRGLHYRDTELLAGDRELLLFLTITLNRLGVGTLVSRFQMFEGEVLDTGRYLRDLQNLRTIAADPVYGYYGSFTLEDLYRLLVCELLSSLRLGHRIEQRTHEDIDREYGSVLKLHRTVAQDDKTGSISTEMNVFPVFLLVTDLDGNQLEKEIEESCLKIRALLSGDLNWKFKRVERVKPELGSIEVGSRKTAPWFVSQDGVVYILGRDFETDKAEARALIVFELELLLALKHYLVRVNGILQGLRFGKASLVTLSHIRNEAMSNMDEFYNLEMSHKDTTRNRMEKCKNIMAIDSLYKTTFSRMEALSQKLTILFQQKVVDRQITLTIVFGVLGIAVLCAQLEGLFVGGVRWYKQWMIIVPLVVMLVTYTLLKLTMRR